MIFLLSISFVACSSANTPSQGSSASESTDSNSSNNASSNNSSSSNNNSNSGENTTLNDTSFKIGVDDQPFNLSRAGMSASNESGDYMFYINTLYFHDNAANTTVIACNKPDCDHITNVDDGESDCNAFSLRINIITTKVFHITTAASICLERAVRMQNQFHSTK